MHAYSEEQLGTSLDTLGQMLDYAVNGSKMPLRDFYSRFLASRVADAFGAGFPKYLVGMSGIELAIEVLEETGYEGNIPYDYAPGAPWVEYWTGMAIAYLQWYTGHTFSYIDSHGMPIESVAEMFFPYHEADLTKFLDVALERLEKFCRDAPQPVKEYREILGISQEELARRTGVSLRMIRAYEQGKQDLSRAEARTLLNLSWALHCSPEALLPFAQMILQR